MATVIGFRLLTTLSQNTSSRRILLMGLSISADYYMDISWRDSFPSRRLSNMMTTPPQRVLLGSFNVVLLFSTLLGVVGCCYNLMALHIPNNFLGSLVECIHYFQCHDVLEEQIQCMSSTASFRSSSLHVCSIVYHQCKYLLWSKFIDDSSAT